MRKNKLLVLLFYCSIVLLLQGCAKREIKNIDSKGKNIICLGDSITFGYAVEHNEAYPAALARMTDIPVINAGIDGDTSIEGLKRLDSDVLNREPLLVIILYGGNDFLRKIPLEVTINNVKEMVDRIQGKGAMVAIADISTGMFLKDYRLAFQDVAREKKAIFIRSILSGIITNPHLKSDFIHPNAQGYKLIAQRILRAITPYLKQREPFSKKGT